MGSFRLLQDSVSCLENMAGALLSSEGAGSAACPSRPFRFILFEIQVFKLLP